MVEVDFPPVESKRDFTRRYKAGEFGNASPTWDTLPEFLSSGYGLPGELFHIRSRVPGGETYYNVPKENLNNYYRLKGCTAKDYYISAMCPTEKTILQGEYVDSASGPYLRYSRVKKPMREALAKKDYVAKGLGAILLLQGNMDANSYEWFKVLRLRYPYHVIEFTILSTQWGTLPGYNTLFWEVRNY